MGASDIQALEKQIIEFRNSRDWQQFHNPKDVAISLALEANELLEIFQWKSQAEIEGDLDALRVSIGEELSDILYWILLMAYDLKIDILEVFENKMKENEEKYPVEKVKGRKNKYTEYLE